LCFALSYQLREQALRDRDNQHLFREPLPSEAAPLITYPYSLARLRSAVNMVPNMKGNSIHLNPMDWLPCIRMLSPDVAKGNVG
jgi:hypothetical protein